ncbi:MULTISPECIES: 5-formyltetrahydrofolate cyclo-ligase [unclassified Brenneria]|uniref:5-formyltetrahydrofolate cyclo-ligase n=1 Tax=unclassified Brenneria TaxID=2634434 RepID=UPI0015559BE5|nr:MULTISPECIES: 5-formyltetrahydrofolate cyclo-ligase [unclassified Brenneria]MBJ7222361.1 5-formyltetrahydrofolate cyclo-ligase [Brenneria sp. L3-3C-1]MEE3643604.1 5-formyltetrahydrofolate cyclo-ligase [Brenneria sp. L3_3C_1]MEE3651312.1 5-formyltetrahydrofolate cyclo-ligase [Brenneria sp. HEZEL_4_2_4]NPD01268.1 5-formyltetrahydrofolate cyclo-ligase [Brenneria sp. hezel4-2-4]
MQPISSSTPSLSSAQLRQQIRQDVRQRRRQLSAEQQAQFAQQGAERAIKHPKIRQADSVAVFLAFDGELNTQPLIDLLWRQGKRVYLPVLHPFSAGHLLFLRYAPDTRLVVNRLKILEPRLDVRQVLPLQRLDVLLTPLVAFDSQGQRLGMGGGFYDRTLRDWRRYGPYPIGLAHDCQHVEALPVERWDIPLPEIITPSRYWRWEAEE